VIFALPTASPEDALVARNHYLEWTKEKTKVQPAGANCGSVFQNLRADQVTDTQQFRAAAWYIDHAGLKGTTRGSLEVMNQANFINNHGGGTQADFIDL